MATPDRLAALLAQNVVTGIDFVYVDASQITLDVFFIKPPAALTAPLPGTVAAAQVVIHNDEGQPVPALVGLGWAVNEGRDVLRLTMAAPGGFADYRLRIDDGRIDPFFNDVRFSFKANCPRDIDCAPPAHECPPDPAVDFAVDYQARDFWSFRRALLDYASQRHPRWKDRLEADAGVMLAELMSALGDEMSYYQDRVAREATLAGATQRRSVRRHARLVDYVLVDGLGARAWLDFTALSAGNLPHRTHTQPEGTQVQAVGDALRTGQLAPPDPDRTVTFEVGAGLAEIDSGKTYAVDPARNAFDPHIWDRNATCLAVGTTQLHIAGHQAAVLPFDDLPPGKPPGKWMLLKTDPSDPSLPARRVLVRVTSIIEETDPLLPAPGSQITRLAWEDAQALPFELDLETLSVHGNVVPATAGRTLVRRFSIGPTSFGDVPAAIERGGPDSSVAYLYSLPDSESEGLVWLGQDPHTAAPEIRLAAVTWNGAAWVEQEVWQWRRALIGPDSSQKFDRHFTLDDGEWRRVVGYHRPAGEVVHFDYATGAGVTVRFGDGEFGMMPAIGTVFEVTYRLGNGTRGNVPAASLKSFDPLLPVSAVSNPLPALGGIDPETEDEARRLAPDAFRAITFRAVRPEDYAEAAERLPWVQRAGARFRWTGSWLSAFVTADPHHEIGLSPAHRRELEAELDRFRQAGREVIVLAPRYADIDLEIKICVAPSAYPGDVRTWVTEALLGKKGVRPRVGFFDPDHFTFGTPLERSELEAFIQAVPGVRAVENMRIRRRGWFDWRLFYELVFHVGADEVIRLQNDPLHPDQGSLHLLMEGGA